MSRRIDGPVACLKELQRDLDMRERHGPAARTLVHPPPEHKASKRSRRTLQSRNVEFEGAVMGRFPFFELVGSGFEPCPRFTGKLRFVGQDVDDGWVESIHE